MYNVMIWYMYILWNDYDSKANKPIRHLTLLRFVVIWEHERCPLIAAYKYTIQYVNCDHLYIDPQNLLIFYPWPLNSLNLNYMGPLYVDVFFFSNKYGTGP